MLLEVADNGKMFTDKEISEHVVTFIIGVITLFRFI